MKDPVKPIDRDELLRMLGSPEMFERVAGLEFSEPWILDMDVRKAMALIYGQDPNMGLRSVAGLKLFLSVSALQAAQDKSVAATEPPKDGGG
jgi:hypothetical protein